MLSALVVGQFIDFEILVVFCRVLLSIGLQKENFGLINGF